MRDITSEEVPTWVRMPTVVIVLLLSMAGSCWMPESGPRIGNAMPEVRAEDVTGHPKVISSMDAPCILFFYTPSCTPCNRLLESLYRYFEKREGPLPLLFLLVKQEKRDALLAKTLPRFPVLIIGQNTWKHVFQINRTPILLFYQAQGRLVRKQLGFRSITVQGRILNDFVREIRKPTRRDSRLSIYPFSKLSLTRPRVQLIQTSKRRY